MLLGPDRLALIYTHWHPPSGTLNLRIHVGGEDGAVQRIDFLADTLIARPSDLSAPEVRAYIQHLVHDTLIEMEFPPCDAGDSSITLPLLFD